MNDNFVDANEEFMPIAKQLHEKYSNDLNVLPDKLMFLRRKTKHKAYAYVKPIREEYQLLTEKKYFVVIVDEMFNPLSDERKKWVILHEYFHCYYDEEKDQYKVRHHDVEDFSWILKDSTWNLELVDGIKGDSIKKTPESEILEL